MVSWEKLYGVGVSETRREGEGEGGQAAGLMSERPDELKYIYPWETCPYSPPSTTPSSARDDDADLEVAFVLTEGLITIWTWKPRSRFQGLSESYARWAVQCSSRIDIM